MALSIHELKVEMGICYLGKNRGHILLAQILDVEAFIPQLYDGVEPVGVWFSHRFVHVGIFWSTFSRVHVISRCLCRRVRGAIKTLGHSKADMFSLVPCLRI